jgi:uncharacterized protein YkwD
LRPRENLTNRSRRPTRTARLAVFAALLAVAPVSVARGSGAPRPHARALATAACANADRRATSAPIKEMRAAVVCLINKERAAHHLPPLAAARKLDRSAQGWTNTMVADGFFSHGANFAARISATGFVWSAAGENIASGFVTPRRVVSAWMSSTGHCQNILSAKYRDVGTGESPHGIRGSTVPATWTQDFALPMGRSAPSNNWGPANGCPY